MPALYPPDYPYRPDAPLLSFGPSFSEEISLSVLRATWQENDEQPRESDIRAAAALTMLEGYHPRDHLECMLAAEGVGFHCAALDSLARAARPGQSDAMVLKFRANAATMSRSFLAVSRDMDRRHGKPLPPRPPAPGAPPPDPPADPPPASATGTAGTTPRRPRADAKTAPPPAAAEAVAPPPAPLPNLEDLPELPEDIETRPDGTPGSLNAYAPKQPALVVIPRIAPIMAALGTRPSLYRIVNDPASQIVPATGWPRPMREADPAPGAEPPLADFPPPKAPAANHDLTIPRGPVDMTEPMFSGDALARFASARFDPGTPPPPFEDDASVVELELISTGGDPELEARRAAMIAAHPEGKPIVVLRHGPSRPPADGPDPPPDRCDEHKPDT